MPNPLHSRRSLVLGTILLLGVATAAYAQYAVQGGPGGLVQRPVYEYTQQEVQAALLVQTLNDLSKQHWDVFQVIPAWTVRNQNGETELAAKTYQIIARRPMETKPAAKAEAK
jgi:hypothetical protein